MTLLRRSCCIGDGANDISIIESAGIGIAFNAKDSVKEKADVVVDEKDLTKVLMKLLINYPLTLLKMTKLNK